MVGREEAAAGDHFVLSGPSDREETGLPPTSYGSPAVSAMRVNEG
jgi:hypothetical protein